MQLILIVPCGIKDLLRKEVNMTDKELRLVAIDTVIKYAAEQGVKLRRLDFPNEIKLFVFSDECGVMILKSMGKPSSVMVKVSYVGRWEKQLKAAKERFLNYFNARLEEHHLTFSFTVNELEIIAMDKNGEKPDEEEISKVIDKINRLLALSDQSRNPSENEAISASLKVQKLLAKYNLSMADVTGERKEEDVEQSIADVGTGRKWKYSLATAVANNFACKSFFVGRNQIVFYGYKADIVAARRVFVYLFKVGDKLANQYAKKEREMYGSAEGIYNSFCKGFVAGVRKELEKQCTALAIVVQPKVQESWDVFSSSFGTLNAAIEVTDPDAYEEGFVEGKRALNAQYLES